MEDDISRPITLYVQKFVFKDIKMDYLNRRRVTVLDIEMNKAEAREMLEYLQKRLDEDVIGTIRVRAHGHLTL